MGTDYGALTAVLFRTFDGGTTWERTPLPTGPDIHAGSEFAIDFSDPLHGTLLKSVPVGEHAFFHRTSDGGLTWSEAVPLPTEGQVRFLDEYRGWESESFWREPRVYSSVDSGESWTPRKIAIERDLDGAEPLYGLPTFFNWSHGVLPVTFWQGKRGDVAFYSTSDGGRSFSLSSRLHTDAMIKQRAGFFGTIPVAIASQSIWWVATPDPIPGIFVTTSGGEDWKRSLSQGLPAFDEPTYGSLTASGEARAWLSIAGTVYETADGGETWRRLRVPKGVTARSRRGLK